MGQTISSRLEWTNSGSNLVTGIQNEAVLNDLANYVQVLYDKYPTDAETEFKKPLQYVTSLRSSHFDGSSDFSIHSTGGKFSVVSTAQSDSGYPLLELNQVEKEKYVLKVYNFAMLKIALHLAGSNKLIDLQSAVQDFLAHITGLDDLNATYLEAFEALSTSQEEKVEKKCSKKRLMHLLMLLNNFDLEILMQSVKNLSNNVFLNMNKVNDEVKLLKTFCGNSPTCSLKSIDWENPLVFANGYRVPPWRQIHGELAYIIVSPVDQERIVITASQSGYFINKGYVKDENGETNLNYEKDSEIYNSLINLLRAKSQHFAKNIDNQDATVKSNENEKRNNLNETKKLNNNDKRNEKEVLGSRDLLKPKLQPNAAQRKKNNNVPRVSNTQEQPSLRWKDVSLTQPIDAPEEERQTYKIPLKPESGKKTQLKNRHHNAHQDEDSDPEQVSTDDEVSEKRQEGTEAPPEYWQIQKLIKYLKIGNQTATVITLCAIKDLDLTNDMGGLEVLINLLGTDDPKCKVGALQILKEVTKNGTNNIEIKIVHIRRSVAEMNGIHPLVELLRESNEEILRCLAAETISHCAKNATNRRMVRKEGGIRRLIRLLKSKNENVARCGALALCSCSKSDKNKDAIRASGSIPLLAELLKSKNVDLLIPVVGILQECASDPQYRVSIRSSGIIRFLVENLSSQNHELQAYCASAIFKCAEDEETRVLVNEHGGLAPLVQLLDHKSNRELLIASTGAIWKCAHSPQNVDKFNSLKTVKKLVGLIADQPEDVLVNIVGAIGACAKSPEGRAAIRESNGITPLVGLLTGTNQALLVNVTAAVGVCACDADSMAIIDRLDGVRLLWSLLKSPNPNVQASAAWAISPCIENAKDAGEMVRSFVGGLELIVSLLKSENTEVLASVCAAIANIAKDEENLAVITDHGVVPLLAKLTTTKHDKLRKHLAEAIARCCRWGNNRVAFGSAGAVAPLVKYLKSPDEKVHRSTAQALHQLSKDADNCVSMHENGVVQLLLGMVGSRDEELQEAAAGCIENIRRLALASEKAALK
ncbi:Beta Catenin-related Armadillo repeat-containing protein [Rozella allomycis CSF55]|uniref:Beta Catenin-related Armadillo repeat-containing protein n=1 Tax=Rozella allomycis (strain CSF55) TaxID=988480 RepID=A0A075ARC4_ROZAC|nr:Beta Catenin-related Armadillo repeat-containing protein [Rozella allomycis CSF55]|eukprot:EPZ31271.1 Beta Catenin-related Armadillo repeat-containing protein [Rozella allomycis CSF55]